MSRPPLKSVSRAIGCWQACDKARALRGAAGRRSQKLPLEFMRVVAFPTCSGRLLFYFTCLLGGNALPARAPFWGLRPGSLLPEKRL